MGKFSNINRTKWALSGLIFFCVATSLIVACMFMAGCASQDNTNASSVKSNTAKFLNFKPEVVATMKEAAEAYKKETGNEIIVNAAANGQYSTVLTSQMSTDDAPTLFVIGGQKDLATWKNYVTDITDSWANKHLNSGISSLVGTDGKVYGVPYLVEGYGIIYNKKICNKYFALTNRQTSVNSMEEIKSFDQLKNVAEDMQLHKDEIGIDGAFASTSLKTGHEFRWQTHLANLPITQEFIDRKVNLSSDDVKSIDFRYSDKYKQIFDLYINNSIITPKRLGTVAVTDSMAEFALGQCAMVQNGNWAWGQIKGVKGTVVAPEDVGMLPIYMGLPDEATQGLAIGTENFYAINSKSTKEQQENALQFIEWMYSSPTGKDFVVNKLNYIAPFDTMGSDDKPSDPLGVQVMSWMNNKNVISTPWYFTVFPSQNFKNMFGQGLLRYAQGQKDWDVFKQSMVDLWYTEYNSSIYN